MLPNCELHIVGNQLQPDTDSVKRSKWTLSVKPCKAGREAAAVWDTVSTSVTSASAQCRICAELESAGREAAAAGRMLRKWAPVGLRALYERDLRRCFCPPALWLAPFEACRPCGALPQLRA